MKKMIKKTSALAISAFMLAQYVPFSVVAFDSTHSDLTIHPYVIDESTYNTRKAAGSAGLTGTTNDKPETGLDGNAVESLTFTIVSVNENGVADGTTTLTGQESNTKITLPDGKYKITPENNDTDAKFKSAEAFYIQLPAATTKDVHIYPKFTDNNDNDDKNDPTVTPDSSDPKSDNKHSIKLTKSLSDAPSSHDWTTSAGRAGFNAYFKNQLGKWEKVMDGANAKVYYTNASGEVIVDGLPLGDYCLVEVDAPDGYLLNSNPVEFSLKGGSGVSGNNQTGTLANDKELTVKKEIAYTTEGNGYGQKYNWTITADVPSQSGNLIKYEITDEYTNLKDVTVESIDGLTADDYTVTSDTGKIVISIKNPKNLTGTSLKINVTSKLAEGVTSGTAVTNKSSIKYQYAYAPDPTVDPTDIPDPNPDDPSNPYPAPINYPADPTNPDSDTVATFTPKTIIISNVDSEDNTKELTGSFEITSFSTHADDETGDNAVDAVPSDKMLTLANLAPGKYTITQKSTESGYSIASPDSKTIFIAEDGKVYEGNDATTGTEITAESGVSYKITFLNAPITSGFNLPFTGTTATIVFSITGILLMAGTAFFIFIILKKKDEEEEEQENS
jgi:fimbrial isopeptide formation D2 family protein